MTERRNGVSRFGLAVLIVCGVVGSAVAGGEQMDRFGGCTAVIGERTGRWHIEQIHGRHWFVTPEGHGFYVLGMNHIRGGDEEENAQVLANLRAWHFNTAGYDQSPWIRREMPHFLHVSLHEAVHWLPADRFEFADVFSERFAQQVGRVIAGHCKEGRENPYTIGYSLTDTPRYDLDIIRRRRGSDWVSALRQLGAEAAGKKRYVAFLQRRYPSFESFQKAYRLGDVDSFEALYDYSFEGLELTRPAIRRDDEAFLVLIAERIYQLTREAFDRYHPEAIVMSEKFKMHDHPLAILRLAGKYYDVVSIQPGPTHGPDVGQGPDESQFNAAYWRDLHRITGKPVLICDHACSFYTAQYPRTLWHQLDSQEDAARHYDRYVRQTAAEPYILGYQRCQYMDRYDPLRTLLKQGLVNHQGLPYDILTEQIGRTNEDVLKRVYGVTD